MTDANLIGRILTLKKKLNAVILAHNYQLGEVQEVADFCGDSLELSLEAAKTANPVILFAGVRFMAETAKILSPEKTVLLPREAGCEMADMATASEIRKLKSQHPDAIIVCYVNSTAEVKAECDWCVTSANAPQIIAALPENRPIIFLPDRNLGNYCNQITGKKMILWDGFCPVHQRLDGDVLTKCRSEFPDAEVIIHPEAPREVRALADKVLSTGGMLRHVRESNQKRFIVATETGLIYRLRRENPDKVFIAASEQTVCPWMKMNRLEDIAHSLENLTIQVELAPELIEHARLPIERMLNFNKS